MNHISEINIELIKRGIVSELSLFDKQKEAVKYLIDNQTKILFYGGAAGGGKSWLGCEWEFDMAMAYPETRYFIGRQELKRIRQSTLITFHKLAKFKDATDSFSINNNDNFIQFKNGSRIDLLDLRFLPSDPLYERFGSIEYTCGWIEECGETHFDAFEVIKTRTGRHNNKEYGILPTTLCTLNPKKNWCYTLGYKPYKNGTLPLDTKFIQAFYYDNPRLDKAYIENLESIKDKSKRERLLHGNWEYDDDPNWLIESYDKLTDIFSNVLKPSSDKYMTIDVARLGDDKVRIGVWEGWGLVEIKTINKCRLDELVKELESIRRRHRVSKSNCIADEDGVGGGVIDFWKCKGFVNNSTAFKIKDFDNFTNKKSQCGFFYAQKVNSNETYISENNINTVDLELIKEELEQLKRKEQSDDAKQALISKDEIKRNIGRSPDLMDMLLMRSWFDLNKIAHPIQSINYPQGIY